MPTEVLDFLESVDKMADQVRAVLAESPALLDGTDNLDLLVCPEVLACQESVDKQDSPDLQEVLESLENKDLVERLDDLDQMDVPASKDHRAQEANLELQDQLVRIRFN